MTGELTVRRYEPGDAERVWELHVAAMRDAGTDPAAMPPQDDLRDVEGAYFPGGEFLVGERDGHIVAMGGFQPRDGETVELKRMRVAPDHQRRGYGTRILAALEDRARERGFRRAVLDTAVRQDSPPFYRARGYEAVGREQWREFDLVCFEKEL
ncbi:MAG: GNAT family N-acetyltransferase [Halobacteriaceae archaeon]